ncbi:MAG: hypothetical protein GQ569_10120 [Methylococcaceae bacterium]|nr:hypothetical protein [Methylococcaceae bacterium]
MSQKEKLKISLFLLRFSVFVVMLMWTLDKFINPAHATKVYEKFYFIGGLGDVLMYTLAVFELIILVLFLGGLYKKYIYGIVLFFHAVSTLSSFKQYLSPYEGANLLFFTAWPMLAACIVLFLLKEQDELLTIRRPVNET